MAQIVINYDSKAKTISASMDGTELSPDFLDYIMLAKQTDYENGGKKWCCCINMCSKNEEDGVNAYVQICAAQTPKLQEAGIEVTHNKPVTHQNLAKAYEVKKNGGSA